MRHTIMRILPLAALSGLLGAAAPCHAQALWGGEVQRAFSPGAYVPYDGASFTHRYSYPPQTNLFFNMDSRRIAYLDYIDRLDRAERFGYEKPLPPPTYCRPPSRWGVFLGGWYFR